MRATLEVATDSPSPPEALFHKGFPNLFEKLLR
jgi:hypothetical protein